MIGKLWARLARPTERKGFLRLGPLFTQDIVDTRDGKTFLRRYGLKITEGCRIYLHHMLGPDPGRDAHNHPFHAWFMCLKGGYVEERAIEVVYEDMNKWAHDYLKPMPSLLRTIRPGTINAIKETTFHTVKSLLGDTWTIGLVLGRLPSWGFYVPGRGVVDWREYHVSK